MSEGRRWKTNLPAGQDSEERNISRPLFCLIRLPTRPKIQILPWSLSACPVRHSHYFSKGEEVSKHKTKKSQFLHFVFKTYQKSNLKCIKNKIFDSVKSKWTLAISRGRCCSLLCFLFDHPFPHLHENIIYNIIICHIPNRSIVNLAYRDLYPVTSKTGQQMKFTNGAVS